MELGLILAVGIFCFLLVYFAFKLDEEHNFLRVLVVFFFVFALLLLPKAALDYNDNCELVETEAFMFYTYGNNLTSGSHHWDGAESEPGLAHDLGAVYLLDTNETKTYEYICKTNTNNTGTTLLKLSIGLVVVFSAYVFIFLISAGVFWLSKRYRGKK